MLIILSPAKKQNFSKTNNNNLSYTQPILKPQINELIKYLRKLDVNNIKKLMSVSDNIAKLNYDRFKDFNCDTYTNKNSKATIFALEGDVYKKLSADTMTEQQLNYAQDNIVILSGLYGYLRPLDLMQPYRLEMKTKLTTNKANNLYKFWGDLITDQINKNIINNKHTALINLASGEYFSSINTKKIESETKAKIINIIFKENKDNKPKVIGVMAKRARGLMARYIITNQIKDPNKIKLFNLENYKFQENISDDNNFIFIANRD